MGLTFYELIRFKLIKIENRAKIKPNGIIVKEESNNIDEERDTMMSIFPGLVSYPTQIQETANALVGILVMRNSSK